MADFNCSCPEQIFQFKDSRSNVAWCAEVLEQHRECDAMRELGRWPTGGIAPSKQDPSATCESQRELTGHHVASWLHPEAQIDAGTNVKHYIELAQTAERGKFDLMFLADALATRDGNLEALSRWPQYMAYFEPITLLSAIASVTKHIGLVSTATTSYNEPYNVARKYASLDHISHGRAALLLPPQRNCSLLLDLGPDTAMPRGSSTRSSTSPAYGSMRLRRGGPGPRRRRRADCDCPAEYRKRIPTGRSSGSEIIFRANRREFHL